MAHWIAVLPEERFFAERLFHHDTVEIPTGTTARPAPGDDVVLVADGATPLVFGLGQVSGATATAYDADDPDAPTSGEPADTALTVTYTHRLLDDPIPARDLGLNGSAGTTTLPGDQYTQLAGQVQPQHAVNAPRRDWLVSVDLPIEATSQAEAVRQFWSYVMTLGPQELPAFVAPADDELAMQAYVLGEETELDPEDADEG